jgi:hypothetical protein
VHCVAKPPFRQGVLLPEGIKTSGLLSAHILDSWITLDGGSLLSGCHCFGLRESWAGFLACSRVILNSYLFLEILNEDDLTLLYRGVYYQPGARDSKSLFVFRCSFTPVRVCCLSVASALASLGTSAVKYTRSALHTFTTEVKPHTTVVVIRRSSRSVILRHHC